MSASRTRALLTLLVNARRRKGTVCCVYFVFVILLWSTWYDVGKRYREAMNYLEWPQISLKFSRTYAVSDLKLSLTYFFPSAVRLKHAARERCERHAGKNWQLCADTFDAASAATLVLARYKEDTSWLNLLSCNKTIYQMNTSGSLRSHEDEYHPTILGGRKQTFRWGGEQDLKDTLRSQRVPAVLVRTIENRGDEAHAYLRFIIDHYEDLPGRIAFVHAHRTHWHATYDMAEYLRCICLPKVGSPSFVDLNSGGGACDFSNDDAGRVLINASEWGHFFKSELGDMPVRSYCHSCCAQFITVRARVLSHPKAFYQHILDGLLSNKLNAFQLEIVWRLMFTESA